MFAPSYFAALVKVLGQANLTHLLPICFLSGPFLDPDGVHPITGGTYSITDGPHLIFVWSSYLYLSPHWDWFFYFFIFFKSFAAYIAQMAMHIKSLTLHPLLVTYFGSSMVTKSKQVCNHLFPLLVESQTG